MRQQHLNAHYRKLLIEIYQAALVRVEGRSAVSNWLKQNALPDSVRLIAIGKAAQSMAHGASDYLGDRINQALIISKSGHVDHLFCRQHGWVAHEAAHPVPDETTLHAGQKLLDFLADGSDLPLLFLISGGASSLVEVPIERVDLAFLSHTNDWLLGSGLDIFQMNWIRKGLSQIKGGGLIRYLGEREAIGLAISDVPGDDPAVIGSGLLVPDLELPERLAAMSLPSWLGDRLLTSVKQWPLISRRSPRMEIVANLQSAREAAAERAEAFGLPVSLHHEFLQGDTVATGQRLARALLNGPSGVFIWGGETTVTLPPSPGQGGRNQHLAVAAARELAGSFDCFLLAAGTDGTDGPTEDACALVDGGTVIRAAQSGVDVDRCLDDADSGHLLEVSGDLITTGPTGTNVMDLVIGLRG
ncbi:MAG: DUF4147 domain-containing protein [Candidatus Thiodiazotropha sp. (ex Ustalcina ferruginea)]|nr:DUF4147 domain-containing protein [Candidatus Thiodiazotropha sp. (ex Ustalcina ferruginea)]